VLRVPLLVAVLRRFSLAGDAVASGDARFWGLTSRLFEEESA